MQVELYTGRCRRRLGHTALARAISHSMVRLQRRYYGVEPREVRTYADGHFVCCVLVDPFTSFEKSLLSDVGQEAGVREIWQSFQQAMATRFKQAIAAITGHDVIALQSEAHADPDLVVVVFELSGEVELARQAG